jgi:hypothetical protein
LRWVIACFSVDWVGMGRSNTSLIILIIECQYVRQN